MGKLEFDNNEFDIKYNKYSKLLYRTAYQYLLRKDAAEDIVQEAFIKLFTRKKPFNNSEHEKAWLLRVTINLCKNCLISKSANETELNEEIISDKASFEKRYETQIDLEHQLDKLSPEQRTCIYLYYYEGYKIKEISAMLNLNINTVKSMLSRARQSLRNYMDKENGDEL